MISATSNALVQRRGSLIQRRNSKRFVLSELSSVAAAAAAAAIAAEPAIKDAETSQKDDYLSIADLDGSDDDETFKVPDIVLDILPEAPLSPITYCRDPTDTVEDVPEWKLLKLLKKENA